MSKAAVLDAMGTKTIETWTRTSWGTPDETITNPFRTEAYPTANDGMVEVLFYYTDKKRSDGSITDDELTPIVVQDDHLVGWGWMFWESAMDRYEITIRNR